MRFSRRHNQSTTIYHPSARPPFYSGPAAFDLDFAFVFAIAIDSCLPASTTKHAETAALGCLAAQVFLPIFSLPLCLCGEELRDSALSTPPRCYNQELRPCPRSD